MVKFCPHCGAQIRVESAQFCNDCGSKINGTSNVGQPRHNQAKSQETIESGGKPLTVEFFLGLIGGIIGFIAGFFALLLGSIASVFGNELASNAYNAGYGILFFSILGIIGAAMVKSKTKTAGYLMIISAIGGIFSNLILFSLSFLLLIIAGILAVRHEE